MFQRETQLRGLLSSTPETFCESVGKLQTDLRASLKVNKALSFEVAEFLSKELLEKAAHQNNLVVSLFREDADILFLTAIAQSVLKENPQLICLLGAKQNGDCMFLLQATVDINDAGKKVAACLGGRGGGKQERFQGKFSNPDKFSEAVQLLESLYPNKSQ